MTDLPAAYIHRTAGHVVGRPHRVTMPALVRFAIGIWPATLTGLAALSLLATGL